MALESRGGVFGERLHVRLCLLIPLSLIALVAASCGGANTRSASVGDAPAATAPIAAMGAHSALVGSVKDIDGVQQDLSAYKGKVVLVVNTASRCGFTDQYTGLETLYSQYASKGFVVLGFPSNDFKQELASDSEVKTFCSTTYGVTFPLFAMTAVTGPDANPLFAALAAEPGDIGAPPKWNFTKYLLNRAGVPVARWNSNMDPTEPDVIRTIEALLQEQA